MGLTDGNILRYSRNILIQEIGPEGQEKMFCASALVVGAGGLGSPALLYLAAAGVGRLGVVDRDRVEISNLNRQVIHPERSVGQRKVRSAGETIRAIRSDLRFEEHEVALTAENAVELFRQYDVVIDGSDNFPTKYLCSDASVLTKVPLVHAGVLRFGGQMTTVLPGTGPCLRCLIPEIPPRRDAPTCADSGILGAVAGIFGSWQAAEAIKVLLGKGEPLAGRLLTLDTLGGSVSVHKVYRDPRCPSCGESPRIRLPL
ncbi:MAG TPA: HesA/MoeB/ThiF family protein, partial [Candidatus Deferrimicrobiaceae bacterium]|nr:HesA/MoeB/ThiF family protein [Candidatus Deferrimicrobiaceae bacterium]